MPTSVPASDSTPSVPTSRVPHTSHGLPERTTPVPPEGFVPPDARDMLGSHPRLAEVAHAAAVVEELRSFSDYDATFGVTVPPSQRIAELLDVARKWRMHRDEAAAWNTYVRAQDALAWKQALDLLDELKPAYKLAVGQKPALATTYPRLATFFDTHKNIAERASVTKKTKKKEKAAEAAAQAQATEAVSLAPSTPKSTQSLNPR